MKTREFTKARERAYKLLARRSRSAYELSQRLKRVGFAPSVIQQVLVFLQEDGLVDDRSFAREWVHWRLSNHPLGKNGLTWELKAKGIAPEIITEALEELDEEWEYSLALSLAKQRLKQKGFDYPWYKLAVFLNRRGFSSNTIYQVCHSLWSGIVLDIL